MGLQIGNGVFEHLVGCDLQRRTVVVPVVEQRRQRFLVSKSKRRVAWKHPHGRLRRSGLQHGPRQVGRSHAHPETNVGRAQDTGGQVGWRVLAGQFRRQQGDLSVIQLVDGMAGGANVVAAIGKALTRRGSRPLDVDATVHQPLFVDRHVTRDALVQPIVLVDAAKRRPPMRCAHRRSPALRFGLLSALALCSGAQIV
jgi:hypothetical protein